MLGCAAGGTGWWWNRCPDMRPTSTPSRRCVQPQGVELAYLDGDALEEVTAATERGIQRIRGTPHLAYSFLRYCGLSLW